MFFILLFFKTMLAMINSSTFQYQREKIVPDEKEVNEQMPLFIACVIFRAEWNGWLGGICLFQGIFFPPLFLLSSVDRKLDKDKRCIIPVTLPNVHPLLQAAAAVHTNSLPALPWLLQLVSDGNVCIQVHCCTLMTGPSCIVVGRECDS